MDSEKKISEIIEGIEHPAITLSLKELGIVRSYDINGNSVSVVMAFPALNIPILDMLVQRVQQPLEAIDVQVSIEKVVMTPEELEEFLAKEQSGWKGM